jgi:plastocyanin
MMNQLFKMITTLCLILVTPLALAATHTVKMKSISFEPKTLTIKVGDTVEWNNISYTQHSATSEAPVAINKTGTQSSVFDTGLVEPKKSSAKVKFEKPGTFKYHCSIHGRAMSAVIEVQP